MGTGPPMSPALLLDPVPGTSLPRFDETGWPLLPPTLLTVHRTSALDEQSRHIACRLDGERLPDLYFGDTCTIEIAPGPHLLRTYNTLVWKKAAFDAAPGAHVHFTVWNRAPRGYYGLITFIGVAPLWLELERGLPEEIDCAVRSGGRKAKR